MYVLLQGISGTVDGDGKSCSPHQINKEAGLVEDAMEMEVVWSVRLASFGFTHLSLSLSLVT